VTTAETAAARFGSGSAGGHGAG